MQLHCHFHCFAYGQTQLQLIGGMQHPHALICCKVISWQGCCYARTLQTTSLLASIADEEMAANPQDSQTVLLVPTDNDGVTEVLQMLEQELAAYEEQELAAIGTGRGGRGGRGRGRGRATRSTRLEMEDLVDLAHETALARYKVHLIYIIPCIFIYWVVCIVILSLSILFNVNCIICILYYLMVAKHLLKDACLVILYVPSH